MDGYEEMQNYYRGYNFGLFGAKIWNCQILYPMEHVLYVEKYTFAHVIVFLKRKNIGYKAKKSDVFSR